MSRCYSDHRKSVGYVYLQVDTHRYEYDSFSTLMFTEGRLLLYLCSGENKVD